MTGLDIHHVTPLHNGGASFFIPRRKDGLNYIVICPGRRQVNFFAARPDGTRLLMSVHCKPELAWHYVGRALGTDIIDNITATEIAAVLGD